jgi:hypothetical protein
MPSHAESATTGNMLETFQHWSAREFRSAEVRWALSTGTRVYGSLAQEQKIRLPVHEDSWAHFLSSAL